MDLNNEIRAELQKGKVLFSGSNPTPNEENTYAHSPSKSTAMQNPPFDATELSHEESQSEIIPYSGAPPLNSARATPSQLRALERIKKKNRSLMILAQRPVRRVMNYATANSD